MLDGYVSYSHNNMSVEKHFTLDKNLPGPDHWFSEDPDGLKNWVDSIRTATIMLGSEEVKATEKEEKTKILARRSVVALSDIKQGESFNKNNIGLRRQSKLTKEQAKFVARCNSVHRDVSLNF